MSRGLGCLMSGGSEILVGGGREEGKYHTYDSSFLSRPKRRGNGKRRRGREGEKAAVECNESCTFVLFVR